MSNIEHKQQQIENTMRLPATTADLGVGVL